MTRLADCDPGLRAAIAAAGGRSALMRAIGMRAKNHRWRTTPQRWLFAVAEATGLDPAMLRPDLAAWIGVERARLARIAGGEDAFGLAFVARRAGSRQIGFSLDAEMTDLWAVMAAARFAAFERRLRIKQLFTGETRAEQSARAWAMALAHVVGRASHTHVGAAFGVSRQNVQNAAERYIRARDGDDPDDFVQGLAGGAPRVVEASRLRGVKTADETLWQAEQRFRAQLEGPGDAERRRA